MNWKSVLNAGVVGGLAMTALGFILRAVQFTPMNGEMMLGSMVTQRMNAPTWFLGLAMHLGVAVAFATAYAWIFERLGRSGWKPGLAIGAGHAVFSGLTMLAMPLLHPMIPEPMPAPGAFAAALGWPGVTLFVVEHLMFGAIVGAMYVVRPVPTVPEPLFVREREKIGADRG